MLVPRHRGLDQSLQRMLRTLNLLTCARNDPEYTDLSIIKHIADSRRTTRAPHVHTCASPQMQRLNWIGGILYAIALLYERHHVRQDAERGVEIVL
jgi:hypothetical protein